MKNILLIIYESLVCIVPALLTASLLFIYYRRKNIRHQKGYYLLIAVFALYITFVFHVTSIGTLYDALFYGFRWNHAQINPVPFFLSGDIKWITYIINVVLFIPLGVLVYITWPNWRKPGMIISLGAGLSLLIECSQLLNNHKTDIDDLILNTFGALVGCLIMVLVFYKKNKKACFVREPGFRTATVSGSNVCKQVPSV